jgi:hypothetical protein
MPIRQLVDRHDGGRDDQPTRSANGRERHERSIAGAAIARPRGTHTLGGLHAKSTSGPEPGKPSRFSAAATSRVSRPYALTIRRPGLEGFEADA